MPECTEAERFLLDELKRSPHDNVNLKQLQAEVAIARLPQNVQEELLNKATQMIRAQEEWYDYVESVIARDLLSRNTPTTQIYLEDVLRKATKAVMGERP